MADLQNLENDTFINNSIMKVSALVSLIKSDIENKHTNVKVIGEISSFKQWRSGHGYFDIKDESALIPAVIFKGYLDKINFSLRDGLEVIISGRINVYAAQSRLQMIVERIEPIGEGALNLAFLALKEKLSIEGLFLENHKKILKNFMTKVGIVTSLNGAALRDMIKIITSRNPKISILLASVKVQGQGAALEIAQGIKLLDNYDCDSIIVGRGGGSLEDLWAFNEEIVARTIFAAKTPIISAVGHETDYSISDMVADVRAATPTHAAQMVSFIYDDFIKSLFNQRSYLTLLIKKSFEEKNAQLQIKKRLLKDPKIIIYKKMQIIDEHYLLLLKNFKKYINNKKNIINLKNKHIEQYSVIKKLSYNNKILNEAKNKLFKYDVNHVIKLHKFSMQEKEKYLLKLLQKNYEQAYAKWQKNITCLENLSPLKVLARGYGLACDHNGAIVTSVLEVHIGQKIKLNLKDGALSLIVEKKL